MPYCPQCLTEYVEGAAECMDCRVALQPGAPPPRIPREEGQPNARFVPVRIFQGLHAQFQADLARNVLEAEGISSTIIGDLAAELLPGADAVQLLVRDGDQTRASEILRDFLESPVEPGEAPRREDHPAGGPEDGPEDRPKDGPDAKSED
ncbi:MAG TPA: hypothetical protein VG860_13185 [Terriglobia bacterium]|jgi:hypothetical protein|nr:hypothetical protein [Terriglobia bacterium]